MSIYLIAAVYGAGALAVLWMVGAYAVFYGLLLITPGLRLRGRGWRQVEILAGV